MKASSRAACQPGHFVWKGPICLDLVIGDECCCYAYPILWRGVQAVHAHSDADGLPITVFTFQPKNLPLYRRHGYVVICGEAAPVGLPPWWGLRRNPGAGEI